MWPIEWHHYRWPLETLKLRSLLLFKTFLSCTTREMQHVSTICLHMIRKTHVACNFNYLFENKGLINFTASHIHCKCGNISETVPDRVVVTKTTNRKWYMAYRLEAIAMTSSHFQAVEHGPDINRNFVTVNVSFWVCLKICNDSSTAVGTGVQLLSRQEISTNQPTNQPTNQGHTLLQAFQMLTFCTAVQ